MKYLNILFLGFLFIKAPLELKAQESTPGQHRSESSKGSITGKVIDPKNKAVLCREIN